MLKKKIIKIARVEKVNTFYLQINKDKDNSFFVKIKITQTQNIKYYMIPFIWSIQNKKIHGDRKHISGCHELGERWNGKWLLNGIGVSVWDHEEVVKLDTDDDFPLNATAL